MRYKKQQKLSTLIIIFTFVIFALYNRIANSDYKTLKINSAKEIVVDINKNYQQDIDEIICIPDIEVISTKSENKFLLELFNITESNAIKMGYLTDEFAHKTLLNKRIKLKSNNIKTQNCKYTDILVDNQSYRQMLLDSGFAYEKNSSGINFQNKLKEAEKLDLALLNHNSNKYHKLDCKYGQVARDSVLIPTKHLPNEAIPCKYCHTKNNTSTFPKIISTKKIKIFLTDFTKQLSTNNNCLTLICKETVSQINNSKESIDIALYGYKTIPAIEDALKKAKERGVKINIVYDTSNSNYYPETQNILNFADRSSTDLPQFLMHNKFFIFDNSRVITGSMNFAPTGFSEFNSNCIFLIESDEIAQIYKQEFNQMLNGTFHQEKLKINSKTINLDNTKITPYFSPKDKVVTKTIIPLINNAKDYIYIPTFVLTHEKLAQALINAHNRGVDIKIIVDATNVNAKRSRISFLRNSGIKIKTENYAGKIHSKTILIDDLYLISGSMNFSNSGENKNDENCLIIEDKRLTKYYKEFFEYLWDKIPDKYLKNNPSAEGKESIGSCQDGIDNDYDGKTDLKDEACRP